MVKSSQVIGAVLVWMLSSISFAGTKICVDQANLRSLDNLANVIDVLERDTPVTSLGGEKKAYNGFN